MIWLSSRPTDEPSFHEPLTIEALETAMHEIWEMAGTSEPHTIAISRDVVRKVRRRLNQHAALRRRFSHMTNREFNRILIGREP